MFLSFLVLSASCSRVFFILLCYFFLSSDLIVSKDDFSIMHVPCLILRLLIIVIYLFLFVRVILTMLFVSLSFSGVSKTTIIWSSTNFLSFSLSLYLQLYDQWARASKSKNFKRNKKKKLIKCRALLNELRNVVLAHSNTWKVIHHRWKPWEYTMKLLKASSYEIEGKKERKRSSSILIVEYYYVVGYIQKTRKKAFIWRLINITIKDWRFVTETYLSFLKIIHLNNNNSWSDSW